MDMQRLIEMREALEILMQNRMKGAPVIKQINVLMNEIDRCKHAMKISTSDYGYVFCRECGKFFAPPRQCFCYKADTDSCVEHEQMRFVAKSLRETWGCV